jgi:hypothetical protein
MFSSLTHLDVLDISDADIDIDIWSERSGLALLLLLTYAAFLALEDAVVAHILAICPMLLVLISMYSHIDGEDVWTAGQLMKTAPTDGGRVRIPDLKRKGANGVEEIAVTNKEKSVGIASG